MPVEHLQDGIAFDLLETGDAHREYPVHEQALFSGYRMGTNYGVFRAWVRLACVVDALDLSQPLSDRQFQALHDALMDNLVLFFRDRKLTVEQHKAFGSRFGKLHVHPAAPGLIPNHPEIFVIQADEKSTQVAGEEWHSDVSCDREPPMGSILYVTEAPPDGGGDTLFANMYLVYERLSAPVKKMLDGLTAIHAGERYYRGRYLALSSADPASFDATGFVLWWVCGQAKQELLGQLE